MLEYRKLDCEVFERRIELRVVVVDGEDRVDVFHSREFL